MPQKRAFNSCCRRFRRMPLHTPSCSHRSRAPRGLQRHIIDAHRTLDTVERSLPSTPDRVTIRYLLERGRVFNTARQPERARPLFLQAWELASDLAEDFYAVDAAHMLAIIETASQQLVWNLRALERAKRATEPRVRRWLGSLYNNIGWAYQNAGRYDERRWLSFSKLCSGRWIMGAYAR